MDSVEKIRRLIEEGKLSPEEGSRLLEAFESAEARDRVVREELRRARSARGGPRSWFLINLALLIVAFGLLAYAVMILPGRSAPEADEASRVSELVLGQDLDTVVERLETRLAQPGAAADYRLLGQAYELRYQSSGDEEDRTRAAQAFARADRMERRTNVKAQPATFGALFILVVATLVGAWIMLMYNSLALRDERVNERWAQVEAQLQRRLDLIPPLVETVKGYADHERGTLMAVTEARARMLGVLQGTAGEAPRSPGAADEVNQAQEQLAGALGRLLALAESYPDLKASTNFVTLQDQLEGTENRIAVERQRYNDAVRGYNSRLRIFPMNVVGGMFGYESREYFTSRLGAEEPVPVSF